MTNLPEVSSSKIHFESVIYIYWKAIVKKKLHQGMPSIYWEGVVGVLLSVLRQGKKRFILLFLAIELMIQIFIVATNDADYFMVRFAYIPS